MRFATEEARLAHPQARRIPPNLRSFYNKKLGNYFDERFIPLMLQEEGELPNIMRALIQESDEVRTDAWVALCCREQELSATALYEKAQLLRLPADKLFFIAAALGKINVLMEVEGRSTPAERQARIAAVNFHAFRYAAENGHLEVLRYLEGKAPGQLPAMIAANYFHAFRLAAENGHLEVLRYLEEKAPGQLPAMIAGGSFDAFRSAAENGHLEVLRYLERKAPWQLQAMIAAWDFHAFGLAAENGHLAVLRYLEEKAAAQLQAMIEVADFHAFRLAAEKGHNNVINHLLTHPRVFAYAESHVREYERHTTPFMHSRLNDLRAQKEQLQSTQPNAVFDVANEQEARLYFYFLRNLIRRNLIRRADFQAVRDEFLFLMDIPSVKALLHQEVTQGVSNELLRLALTYNNEEAASILLGIPAVRQLAQAHDHYRQEQRGSLDFRRREYFHAFRYAAENGHLAVLRHLEETASHQLREMIVAEDFRAFGYAARNGHLEVLLYLEEKASEQLQEMIRAVGFIALILAAQNGHNSVVNHLLTHPRVFAYAESHVEEYERHTTPFMHSRLNALRAQKEQLQSTQPNAVFDVANEQEARLYFYFLRNLIRRADFQAVRDEFLFLMDIPSVKALLHQEVTQGVSNELLRLALSCNNADAARILLGIPEIQQLAQENNYYRQEQRGGLDLRRLAQDRESSMNALTQGEQERLSQASAHYQGLLERDGAPRIMAHLRNTLQARYQRNPAVIVLDDVQHSTLTLPFSWEEFNALQLSPEDKNNALKAYYRHPDHSAWRYLSKPNHWMHKEAGYVYINEQRTERWSTFEEYNPLIALLYLAASDEEIGEQQGYTQEQRLELFIKELSLIGRAHNWDKTRVKRDARGEIVYNESGQAVTEEFDDEEGDRPSCFSGVKRRLLQSVLGHPLLAILTMELLKQETDEFVRAHFKDRIKPHHHEIWDKIVLAEELTAQEEQQMRALDVSEQQIEGFVASMRGKYGLQFTNDPCFMSYINQQFRTHDPHLMAFGHLAESLFQRGHEQGAAASQLGFFAQGPHGNRKRPLSKIEGSDDNNIDDNNIDDNNIDDSDDSDDSDDKQSREGSPPHKKTRL